MACMDRCVISIFMFELFCTDGLDLHNTNNSFFSCSSSVRTVFHVTVQSGLFFMLQSNQDYLLCYSPSGLFFLLLTCIQSGLFFM